VSSTRPAPSRGRESIASDLFRKLLPVECGAAARQFDGAFEKAAIHLVRDEALAEPRQRALRERGVVIADHPENHLPTSVHDRQFDRLRVRCARIGLEQHDHREQRGGDGHLPFTGVAVHLEQLGLEGFVKQLVAVHPQEGKELSRPLHASHQEFLASREICAREPPTILHDEPPRRAPRRRKDHTWNSASIPSCN
jgi:hypothetical protein